MTDDEWLTPKAADAYVSRALGWGAAMTRQGRETIIGWIAQGDVRVLAMRVVRFEPAPQPPAEPAAHQPARIEGQQSRKGFSAEEVASIGMPVNLGSLPLERSELRDHEMTASDWQAVVESGADQSILWETSEMRVPLRQSWHPGALVIYSGIRFATSDIRSSMELAGLEPEAAIGKQQDVAPTVRGGSRPKAYWEDAISHVWDSIYSNELVPKKQADIESALKDYVASQGHEEPSTSATRERAKKLWARFSQS